MSDQSNILREYLVALGFVVDDAGAKKVETTTEKIERRVNNLAKGVALVATTTQAMVTVFAYQMEKLYYSAQRSQSTASKIRELDYAWRQLGGSGDEIQKALAGMASALRQNPGLEALLEQLGVPVKGRDRADVLNDLVKALTKMPHYVAAQYARMFGLDPDTLYMLEQNLGKFQELQAERRKMAEEMGVDMGAAAEAGKEYASALREIAERAGLLKDALAIKLLPSFRETAFIINEMLKDLTTMIQRFKDWQDFADRLREGFTGNMKGGGVVLSDDAKRRLAEMGAPVEEPHKMTSWWQRMKDSARGLFSPNPAQSPTPAPKSAPAPVSRAPGAGATLEEKQAYLASLEQKYNLPPGWLDRVWKKESGRGANTLGPMTKYGRAKGDFQFIDSTAKQYGLQDPFNFASSADASARYYRDLFKQFGGDPAKAAAAYNWGPGNLQRYGLGRAPAETRGYVRDVAGVTIGEQNNTFYISGVSDPARAAEFAADRLRRNDAEVVRNLRPGVQ